MLCPKEFLLTSWLGGREKVWVLSPGLVTFRGFTNAGGWFGEDIWFLNQLSLSSPFQGLTMVPSRDWIGTRVTISRTCWAVALAASPSSSVPFIATLFPSNPETFRDEEAIRTAVASDSLLSWVLLLQASLPVQVKSEGY